VKAKIFISFWQAVEYRSESVRMTWISRPAKAWPEEKTRLAGNGDVFN